MSDAASVPFSETKAPESTSDQNRTDMNSPTSRKPARL